MTPGGVHNGGVRRSCLVAILVLAACDGCPPEPDDDDSATPAPVDDDDSASDDDDSAAAPTVVTDLSPPATDAVFPNPERGFYRTTALTGGAWFYEGHTLHFELVRLDEWADADLPATFLDSLDAGLQSAREAGTKMVLRFGYNGGPKGAPDASLERVLGHITQLTPVLQDNVDVIAAVQAGFIGTWGEWHTSTHDLLDDKLEITEALLAAVPAERFVQVRTPVHKADMYGGPFPPEDALSGTSAARVGHHNDCFLASADDVGTYPPDAIDEWIDFVAAETLWTPMGGETCAPNPPRSECASALAEMERLHFTYLNAEWSLDVIASWTEGGCLAEIERSMGYRLTLTSVEVVATPTDASVTFQLRNDGWAAPINPRPVHLVIDGVVHPLPDVDVRRWLPGDLQTLTLTVPSGGPGEHTLAVALPDADPGLAADPRFSIRLANDGVWNATSGAHALGAFVVPGAR